MPLHPNLRSRLQPLVARWSRVRFWHKLAACWAGAALLGAILLALEHLGGWSSSLVMPLVTMLGITAAWITALRHRPGEPDWRSLARRIETHHPDLDGRLLTAVQQHPNDAGSLNYLQERLVCEAALHGQTKQWTRAVPASRVVIAQAVHLLAAVLFVAVLWQLRVTGGHALLATTPGAGITVTPGDTTVERGESLVVLARFKGSLPADVTLVINPSTASSRRIPLVKSLADPVFGGSVPEVASNFVYCIEYGGHQTRDYTVKVFEYPRLERADADLTYPAYTGEAAKHIKDTRRISAVQGSHLGLTLQLNKPVVSARLVPETNQDRAIPLLVDTNHPMAALKQFALQASQSYDLRLVDADGRTNKMPAQFVFAVLTNRPPEIQLASPRGDLRPSPLEEISFAGTVWDDFGVQDYGLAYTVAGRSTKFIKLGGSVPTRQKRAFKYVLRLEKLHVQPDQLISWFVWAEDIGPDGKLRRTPGDLYFADVRPFDEVFRQGQSMAGQSSQQGQSGQQGGGQSARLAEMQKQIISATWNLQRRQSEKNDSNPDSNKKPTPADRPLQRQSSVDRPFRGAVLGNAGVQTRGTADAELCPAPYQSSRRFLHKALLRAPASWTAAVLCRFPSFQHLPKAPEVWRTPKPDGRLQTPSLRLHKNQRTDLYAVAPQFAGQIAPGSGARAQGQGSVSDSTSAPALPQNLTDPQVVQQAQSQVLEQAKATLRRERDPRTAALWRTAIQRMERALTRLKQAAGSPGALAEALTEEQSAYEALLRLQQHEYQVTRSRNNRQGGGASQMMQRELDQLDLTQSQNRYETQSQAQAPQTTQHRQQLQIMDRLRELARRQQDLNNRLKELQTELQAARTEQERQEIQRRLKRLQEQEQQMLNDVDRLRQQMDQPENQSNMNDARRQLDQTRQEMERTAQATRNDNVSQALASGTRAQRQLQQIHDQLRKQSSSQFAEDMRRMRNEARELARRQEDLVKQMDSKISSGPKRLSASAGHQPMLDQLTQQKRLLTNLVEQATHVSQQAENPEPLLSRQLYDTLRRFSQDSAKNVSQVQEQLLRSGLMTRSLYDLLRDKSQPDGPKMMDLASDMLRMDFVPPASDTAERSRKSIENLKQGIERAARSVLGDESDALRLAQQQLNQLTNQLQQEISRSEGGNSRTNTAPAQSQSAASRRDLSGTNQTSGRAALRQFGGSEQREEDAQADNSDPSSQRSARNRSNSQPGGSRPSSEGRSPGGQLAQSGQNRPGRGNPGGQPGQRLGGGRVGANAGGGGDGGDLSGSLGRAMSRVLNDNNDQASDPITGEGFLPWYNRLRDVQDMLDQPALRNEVAAAGERARLLRRQYSKTQEKPDWAVVRMQVMKPLAEVSQRIAEELARRASRDALVPIDRDPVPGRYSELVRRYYEELGKDDSQKP